MGREPSLSTRVVEALLNNETYFFRDRSPFDLLSRHSLPELAKKRHSNRRIKIWSAGCSTGQEVYSLAMLFAEQPLKWQGWTIDILGSDVSSSAIRRARDGSYTQFEVQRGLAVTQMIRWFEEKGDQWQASAQLRGKARFMVHNLLEAPPQGGEPKFDIVLCRNVLLYFAPEMRRLAFSRLADACRPDGTLMLGAGETVIGQTKRFGADVNARGLYRRTDGDVAVEKRGGDRRAAAKA